MVNSHWLRTSCSFNLILSPQIRQRQKLSYRAFSTSGISLKTILREREHLSVPLTLSVLDREINLLPDVPTHLYTGAMQSTVPNSTLNSAANCLMAIFLLIDGEHITYPGLVEHVNRLLHRLVPWMMWSLDSFISTPQIFIPIYPPVDGNICANIVTATAVCTCLIMVPYYFPQLFQTLPSSSHFRNIAPIVPRMTLTWILCAELYYRKPEDIIPATMTGLMSGHCGEKYRNQLIQVLQALPADRLTSCLPRLISLMQDRHDTPWNFLLLNTSMVRIVGSPLNISASLTDALLLNRSVHWMCQLIRHVQLADKPLKSIPYAKQIIETCFGYLESIFLNREPRWIVQAINSGLLTCIFAINESSKVIDFILEIITINLVWRSILRVAHRAMKHIRPVPIAAWQKLAASISNRWELRNRINAGFNLCGNEKKCPLPLNEPIRLQRCTGCGIAFCSPSCQRETGEDHLRVCKDQRQSKKAGYPEDFSHRDPIYLQLLIKDTLAKEQTLMEEKTSECTPSETVLACLDYTSYPGLISIASLKEIRQVHADNYDILEALTMAENAVSTKCEDEKTKGILLLTFIPWGNRPRADLQWLEFCPLRDLGCLQLLQEPILMNSLILTR
ncbi:uncharacterized protein ARMOST_01814 [Armillaria ostoyae]|uniref:MYND-type domain-containing protein n=1 Tax=Armillaria ostoyae TaxID=47428 RepID=A0A284QPX8_ARMOS|nr:uncharacterized protein ARMOST_01814 [Armillaria ostoyae]